VGNGRGNPLWLPSGVMEWRGMVGADLCVCPEWMMGLKVWGWVFGQLESGVFKNLILEIKQYSE
jgi:hypothetical protein